MRLRSTDLEKQRWYSSFKQAVKARIRPTGMAFRFLNVVSGFLESDDKLFAFRELFYLPKYGHTGLNRTCFHAFQRLSQNLRGQEVDIVDIGANQGWFLRIAPRFFHIQNLYAYEPLVQYNDFLKPMADRNPKLKIRNVLLGASVGSKVFYHYQDGGNSSTRKFHPEFQAPHYCQNDLVETPELPETRLDVDLKNLGVSEDRPLLIKIDTQGAELEVLAGAEKLFEQGRVAGVIVEMQTQPIYQDQALWTELLKFFQKHDFVLLDVIPGLRKPDQTINEMDGIFVPNKERRKLSQAV